MLERRDLQLDTLNEKMWLKSTETGDAIDLVQGIQNGIVMCLRKNDDVLLLLVEAPLWKASVHLMGTGILCFYFLVV